MPDVYDFLRFINDIISTWAIHNSVRYTLRLTEKKTLQNVGLMAWRKTSAETQLTQKRPGATQPIQIKDGNFVIFPSAR